MAAKILAANKGKTRCEELESKFDIVDIDQTKTAVARQPWHELEDGLERGWQVLQKAKGEQA